MCVPCLLHMASTTKTSFFSDVMVGGTSTQFFALSAMDEEEHTYGRQPIEVLHHLSGLQICSRSDLPLAKRLLPVHKYQPISSVREHGWLPHELAGMLDSLVHV